MVNNITTILVAIVAIAFICLLVFVIRWMLKFSKSKTVRQEKREMQKSLAEALKESRTQCKMTQEFVAETIGVSRQSVSKWESGITDPSTSNLIALAKLYGVKVEQLLQGVVAKEEYN